MGAQTLVEWLSERQEALGESNRRFAPRLGISHEFWRQLKLGPDKPRGKRMTLRVSRAAYAAFPNDRAVICDLALSAPSPKVA